MVRISKKPMKKQSDTQEEQIGSIFDSIAKTDDRPQDRPTSGDNPKPETSDSATLMEKIGQLETRLADQDRRMMQVYSTPTVVVPQQVQEPKAVSMEGLPDPITDAQGYAEELNRRITANWDARQQVERQRQQQQSQADTAVDGLWQEFQQSYPDYAGEADRLDYIAGRVATRLKGRGVDLQRYMYGNREGFMEDVVTEYEKVFGKPETDDNTEVRDQPQSVPRRRNKSQTTDDDDSRTGGIFGGYESGGRLEKERNPPAGDMVKDIQDLQRKSGLF